MSESYFDQKKSRPISDVPRDVFLNSLSTVDRENIEAVIAAFESLDRGVWKNGALMAVGKSVAEETRGTPRKDIDLLILEDGGTDFQTFLSRARALVETLHFTLGDVTYPDPHYDYGHDGSVKIKPPSGTLVDLLSSISTSSVDETLLRMREKTSSLLMPHDFCILARI